MSRTSRPYAVGGTVYWTTYTYDGIGRTKYVKALDGASTTGYGYAGAVVTVTDPAGKSKTFTTDATGKLTTVQETDPNLGVVYTNYSYDVLNQLRTVSMPRGSTTQTFVYAAWSAAYGVTTLNGVGPFLMSATNPENGSVQNTYGAGNLLATKVDAKGQKIAYTYDSYKRVSQVSKYPDGVNEDLCQRVAYNYDWNPDTSNYFYTSYLAGRLASVHYSGASCSSGGNNYIDMYAYSQAGQVTRKTFRLTKDSASGDVEAVYTYDSEGKMLSQGYPLGTTYNYGYDASGRPTSMTDAGSSSNLVAAVVYGPAGEVLSMTGSSVGETRTYNANGQLTQLTGMNGVNLKYNYAAAGSNNGQIASQQDLVSGETITYAYDSLKRLASASSTQGWGQGFAYDGFGNLTAKTALSGNPPVGSYPVDAATNRLAGGGYDANGNQLYGGNAMTLASDVANRMSSATGLSQQGRFEYDPSNKRVMQQKSHFDGNNWVVDSTEFYFYGGGGKKLGTYFASVSGTAVTWSLSSAQVFFRGALISRSSAAAQEDVRGSLGRYFPYGEDRDSTANDAVKFATYTRDSISGLDDAVNRYHGAGTGRFNNPDPYSASAGPSDPGSWNRYSYSSLDPVNGMDPTGEATCRVSSRVEGGEGHGALVVFAVCATAYADTGWAQQYGATIQSYSGVFPSGSGMTEAEARRQAEALETQYEMAIFNLHMRERARSAILHISTDCVSALEGEGIYQVSTWAWTSQTTFYDATQSNVRNQNASPYTSVATVLTIGQVIGGNWALTSNDFTSVVLTLGTAALDTTLVHEMLHTYLRMGDDDTATKLGWGGVNAVYTMNGITAPVNSSFYISWQLNNNCPNVK